MSQHPRPFATRGRAHAPGAVPRGLWTREAAAFYAAQNPECSSPPFHSDPADLLRDRAPASPRSINPSGSGAGLCVSFTAQTRPPPHLRTLVPLTFSSGLSSSSSSPDRGYSPPILLQPDSPFHVSDEFKGYDGRFHSKRRRSLSPRRVRPSLSVELPGDYPTGVTSAGIPVITIDDSAPPLSRRSSANSMGPDTTTSSKAGGFGFDHASDNDSAISSPRPGANKRAKPSDSKANDSATASASAAASSSPPAPVPPAPTFFRVRGLVTLQPIKQWQRGTVVVGSPAVHLCPDARLLHNVRLTDILVGSPAARVRLVGDLLIRQGTREVLIEHVYHLPTAPTIFLAQHAFHSFEFVDSNRNVLDEFGNVILSQVENSNAFEVEVGIPAQTADIANLADSRSVPRFADDLDASTASACPVDPKSAHARYDIPEQTKDQAAAQ